MFPSILLQYGPLHLIEHEYMCLYIVQIEHRDEGHDDSDDKGNNIVNEDYEYCNI